MTESQTSLNDAHQQHGQQTPLELFQKSPNVTVALGAAVIFIATFVAYVPSLRGEFIWDDDYYVTNNRLLQSWGGLQRIWFDVLPLPRNYPLPQYYPMTHTSFWIEYQLWGLNSTGYHVTNVVLHALNALLIWLILRKLAVPGAWIAAAIFAVHPINVESVAWIAERKNVLSGFFFFSSLYVYLRYAGVIPAPKNASEYFALPKERERVYAIALVLFAFALLSKTIAATMPAVVLLVMWWKHRRITWNDVLYLLPFFVLGAGAGVLTSWMEQHRVGAVGADWDYSFVERSLIAGKALWFYVMKLFVPHPLIFNYPRWEVSAASAVGWICLIGAIAVIVALVALHKRIGRGPAAAVLYYAGTLFPALGFVNVFPHRYSFVADHFVYLSSIGLIALFVALVTWACVKYLPRDVFASGAPAAGAAGVLLVFFILSLMRARVYAGPAELWKDTLVKTDQKSWFAANNYGEFLLRASDSPWDEKAAAAEEWFRKTLRLKSDHAEAHYNLGLIAERRGQREEARKWYRESLELRPDYALPLFRLAAMAESEGRLKEAEEMYRRVLERAPQDDNVRLALGHVLERKGDHEGALELYQDAADINPRSASPYVQIGNVLLKEGRGEEAMQYFAEAGRLEPDNPRIANNVGIVFASGGYWGEARLLFERALRLDPTMVDAMTNLGIVAAREGKPDEARELFEQALQINPDFTKARQNLQALKEGRLQPATTRATTAPATAPVGGEG